MGKLKQRIKSNDRYSVKFDVLSGTFIVLSLLNFSFGIIFQDALSLSVAVLLALSMSACVMFKTVKWDFWIDPKEWFWIIVWTAVNISALALINLLVDVTFPVSNVVTNNIWFGKLGAMLVGVTEEVLFGMFLFPFFHRLFGGFLPLSLGSNMAFFFIFHLFVYGNDPLSLTVVTLGRMILTLSVWFTNRSTSAMISHGGWNFLVF